MSPVQEIPDDPVVPSFSASAAVPAGVPVLGVPVFSDLSVPSGAGAQIRRQFLAQRRFEGRPGQAYALLADDGTTVVALGVGEKGKVDLDALRRAGAALARQAGTADRVATTLVAAAHGGVGAAAAAVVEGIGLGAYRYSGAPRLATNGSAQRAGRPGVLSEVTIVGAPAAAVRRGQIAVEATARARDWVNRPPRNLTPRELARLASEAAAAAGLDIDVWDEDRIAAERLGGLLGVAAGAAEPPRLIRLEYCPR
ncbi:MAG: hypothetical protein JO337_06230, partial [Acidimicrobiales bacterium]|nr:hypothetical protein [Acidimicrobiales bacterium]